MKRLIIISIAIISITIAISISCYAKNKVTINSSKSKSQFVIAVIDTGIDTTLLNKNTFCKNGHKDFTGTGLEDRHGHGTHISGLIDQHARNYTFFKKDPKKIYDIKVNYCQIVIKFFNKKSDQNKDSLDSTRKAFRYAIDMKVNMINYSAGGPDFDQEEKNLMVEALNKGIIIVAAAGNERSDIDKNKYYPAMYDNRIYRVGNLLSESPREVASSSNFGKSVTHWENGSNALSTLPGGTYGLMTGTSQAAAIKSGKLIHQLMSK